jgi:hypothetical protein
MSCAFHLLLLLNGLLCMSKRTAFLLTLILLALAALPIRAQDDPPPAAAYIPADFAGFIRLDQSDPAATLQGLNIAAQTAFQLQPGRVTLTQDTLGYEDFLPFAAWFDVDAVSFAQSILPWSGDEIVLAYRRFDAALTATSEDVLLIVPTLDVLMTAGRLSALIQAQDRLRQESYRGVTLYIGDRATLAMTSPAIFIGSTVSVKAALDVQAGAAPPLIQDPPYAAVRDAQPDDAFLTAYIKGDSILPAVNGLLNGTLTSAPILQAFGSALAGIQTRAGFENQLLTSGFDAVGASLRLDRPNLRLIASAVFHAPEVPESPAASFDSSLLEMIPRGALAVHSGTDFKGFIYEMLTALPLANFARELLGGFPIQTVGTASELVSPPTADQVRAAVESFASALQSINGLDVHVDLIDQFGEDYVVAVLPRPNDPVPVLNIPFDVLVVAEAADAQKARDSAVALFQVVFGFAAGEPVELQGWTLTPLGVPDRSTPLLTVGIRDDRVLLATGSAASLALAAQDGDNQLVDQTAWTQFADIGRPDIYVDAFAFYNTFFPSLLGGGFTVSENARTRLVAQTRYTGNGLYQMDVTVSLGGSS